MEQLIRRTEISTSKPDSQFLGGFQESVVVTVITSTFLESRWKYKSIKGERKVEKFLIKGQKLGLGCIKLKPNFV